MKEDISDVSPMISDLNLITRIVVKGPDVVFLHRRFSVNERKKLFRSTLVKENLSGE